MAIRTAPRRCSRSPARRWPTRSASWGSWSRRSDLRLALRRRGLRLGGGHHLHHLELHQVAPAVHPGLQIAAVVAVHHLVAEAEVGGDPASNVAKVLGHLASLFAEAPVDRDGVAVFEPF